MYAIKLQLKLNNIERSLMAQHAGFSRFVYNYGLALYKQVMETAGGVTKKISAIRSCLTNFTKKKPEFIWMNQLSSRVYQNAFIALKNALTRYFKGVGEFPKFKRKLHQLSFTVDSSNGTVVELVDRWFPSSKSCSECGHIQPMKLSDRIFDCQGCGSVKCRDFNASLNLKNAPPEKVRAACSELNDCGQDAADSPGGSSK